MRASDARDIPIPRYLEREGVKPSKIRKGGRELWYASPIRSDDKTPSFKVDTVLNVWYDHGLGEGGTVIDLVCELKSVTVSEALAILDATGLGPQTQKRSDAPRLFETSNSLEPSAVGERGATRLSAGEKEKDPERSAGTSAFKIVSVRDLGHPALLDYVRSRAIDEIIARQHLKEVYYAPKSGVGRFFALGFPCGHGFDARSLLFKGFIGAGKDISVIVGTGGEGKDCRTVAVFEGFMDYLSLLTHRRTNALPEDVIILHSIALKRRATAALSAGEYQSVSLYLDHDDAGRMVTKFFMSGTGRDITTDASGLYAGYKDLNERLIATREKGRP